MLTPKQQIFCVEYLVDLNAKQAAIRAGYKPKNAEIVANQLLKKTLVRAEIDRAMAVRMQRVEVKAEQVVRELARIGFANIRDAVSWGPDGIEIRDSEAIDDEVSAAIAEVSQTQHGIRIKMHSKTDALGKLASHLGLLVDRKEITGKDGGPIESKAQVEHTGKLTLQESVERYQKELAHDADMEAADSTSPGDGDRQPMDSPPPDPPPS